MNTNKIILAGVAGGLAMFLLGFLIYGLALAAFFEANQGPVTGVSRGDDMLLLPLILGNLGFGFLLAIVFGRWANISTFVTGLKAGAVISFLFAITFDLIAYGTTYLMTMNAMIVDILVYTVTGALVGGIVAIVLGRGK